MRVLSSNVRQLRADLHELRLWTVWFGKATDDANRRESLEQIISTCDRISALLGKSPEVELRSPRS
jgi:hypothetical protein